MPPLGKLVGEINGVSDKSFINCANWASEYDSIERKSVGECGTIEVDVDVAVS